MVAKLTILGPIKMKLFRHKGYDVMISFHDITDKILSRDSNCYSCCHVNKVW